MSAINNALSQLSQSQTVAQSSIEKAQIPTIKRFSALPWLIGGFSLSLAVGGWAISQQSLPETVITTEVMTQIPSQPSRSEISLSSPTSKLAHASDIIYAAPVVESYVEQPKTQILEVASIATPKAIDKPIDESEVIDARSTKPTTLVSQTTDNQISQSVEFAQVQPKTETQPAAQTVGEVVVEQVELTPSQLAQKAIARAEKALDANNLDKAISGFDEALRYTPRDSNTRQTLAALYYGKGDIRKAAELLQRGISLAQDDLSLRIALAKLLIKEKQDAAALTPLVYLPAQPSIEYLSLRAALAQKNAQDDLALGSYQQLVQLDADNGRWWLGLGIQLERALQLQPAEQAYQQALTKVGLSSQSHQFIRDRIALLSRLEEQSHAN